MRELFLAFSLLTGFWVFLFVVGWIGIIYEFNRIDSAIRKLDKNLEQTFWLAGRGKLE